MKKYFLIGTIILVISLIIIFIIFFNNESEILYFEGQKVESNTKIYQIDEASAVYTNYSKLYYIDKGNKIDLGIALKDKLITIDKIIDKINNQDIAMDGGSVVAQSDISKNKIANIDFTVIKCNKKKLSPVTNDIIVINDVYIGDYDLDNVCK